MSLFDRIGGNRLTGIFRHHPAHPVARPASTPAARNTARPSTMGRSTFTAAPATARRTPGRTSTATARQAVRNRSSGNAAPARPPRPQGLFGGLLHKAASAVRQATQTASRVTRSVSQGSRQLQHAAQHGLQQARSVAGRVATRVNAHPAAQSLRRTAGFAQRTLGHAQNIQTFGQGVHELAGKARTAVSDVRLAVRNRSLSDAGRALHSVTDTVRSARDVVSQASEARTSLRNIRNDFQRTFPRTAGRLAQTYQRASSAAATVARRTGLDRVATAAQRLTSRVTHNPTAQAFRRTAGFAQRSLGSAHTLVRFGGQVRDLAGRTRTAASDIRTALRTRSLSDAGTALRSSWDTVRSARDVVTSSREARTALRSIRDDFSRTFPRTAERLGQQYQRAASVAGNVAERLGASRVRTTAQNLLSRATQSHAGQALRRLRENTRGLGGAGGTLLQFGQNIRSAVTQAPTAFRDIRQAIRTRTSEDIGRALSSSRNVLGSVRDIAEAAPQARQALRTLGRVAQNVAPRVSARVAETAGRVAARAGESVLGRVATRAATSAIARSGASALGRAAGRFAPGVNIAMAAVDTASFVNTLRDPHASVGAKVTSGITALGSIAAATNIPIVSQAGAAISTVSSFIGGFF